MTTCAWYPSRPIRWPGKAGRCCSPAGGAVEDVGFDGQGFGEAVEPTDPARGMALHEEDGTTAAFRPESCSIWRKLDPISIIRFVPRGI